MRLRIFDWATRKFWVVALWEDRTLRVSFRGPEDGTWFRCWKWEKSPEEGMFYRQRKAARANKIEPYAPDDSQERAIAARSEQDWRDYFDRMAEQFQKQSVPRTTGLEWQNYPEGANTITETGGVREFKIPADASAQPMPAPDRVEYFNADDLMKCTFSAAAKRELVFMTADGQVIQPPAVLEHLDFFTTPDGHVIPPKSLTE